MGTDALPRRMATPCGEKPVPLRFISHQIWKASAFPGRALIFKLGEAQADRFTNFLIPKSISSIRITKLHHQYRDGSLSFYYHTPMLLNKSLKVSRQVKWMYLASRVPCLYQCLRSFLHFDQTLVSSCITLEGI